MKINHKLIIGIIAVCITGIIGLIIIITSYRQTKISREVNITKSDTIAINRVHNLIILDESGSMSGLEKISVRGVNETIQTIKEAYHDNPEQEQFLTLVTFSSQSDVRIVHHYISHNIKDVEEMSSNNFTPDGMTPLWDAMGNMCTRLEKETDDETLVLVTIITDGMENASTEYNRESIKALVDRLDQAGWVFTYIGANQNAVLEANSMGIRNALQYNSDKDGTEEMWEKERNSRKDFYERAQNIRSRQQLKNKYFENN